MFTLKISRNGQPAIVHSLAGIDAYTHFRNDGVRFSVRACGTLATREALADALREAAPAGARIRKVKDGVMVRHPLDMVKAHAAVEADWQKWAASGMTHDEMQRRGINHPAFRAFVDA